ncbi:MAG: EAL domain-containing protein [Pseudomonadota bacterium]
MKQIKFWSAWRERFRFTHIQSRLTLLYTALFAVILIGVASVAQMIIVAHAEATVRAELASSGKVFDRIWKLRAQSLQASSDVLARDFGFRQAVATADHETISSALVSLASRAGVGRAFVVMADGKTFGGGSAEVDQKLAALPYRLRDDQREAVVGFHGETYRLVVSPILAPQEIGWVVFATPLNTTEMRALEAMSAIPLNAAIVSREDSGNWTVAADAKIPDGNDLATFARRAARGDQADPVTIEIDGQSTLVLGKPLAAPLGAPPSVLLLSYPTAKALAPYIPLRRGIMVAGILGLILVIIGSRRLARDISRPIEALDKAARALETGERTEVPVEGRDELGRLAENFNKMSAGIVEREHRIAHLAFHDSLTGLPNRVFFRETLDSSLARAIKRDSKVAVLCLDLDGFKGVNDTLGHPVGDALLAIVGDVLAELALDGTVSRLGGDEFAIILEDGIDDGRPRILAQSIIDRLRLPMQAAGHAIATGASIGIAVGPADGVDADVILKNSDLALYRAKQDGRGVYRFFEPELDAAARRRRQMELDLRDALRLGQLRLEYQPIYDLKNDRVGSFEALLRWDHPERGHVSPVDFIPVAEETGLIVAIGEWVLNEATRQAREWPEHLRVAVNVSPLQFRNTGFMSLVFQALTHSGLAPNRLEIEITESVFLEGAEPTLALLHRLRELGVRVALDDFGTGFSSLSYLRSFPFDKIKIDRSFVTNVAEDDDAMAIVRAIIDLANALHMETTAEGVEHRDQLLRLQSQGCTSIQGFLFSKSVRADDVLAMIGVKQSLAA